jgi:hypothetical protein
MNPEIENTVRSILLEIWDPNGIGTNKNLSDEYDSFIPEIASAIEGGADAPQLEATLASIEEILESRAIPANRTSAALALAQLADR